MVELSRAADFNFDDELLDVRAGFDYRVQDDLHLLFAAATGLREADDGNELDYDLYFGVQSLF